MSTRVVVDPVTRIEGHLRIEAMLNDKGVMEDAISSGTMWRGLEVILQGRDPRDAWAFCERICGVCTTVHALASVRAVESAVGITVPKNAEIIRNIMELTQYGPGPCDSLLSPACSGLGGRGIGAQGRSGSHRGARSESIAELAHFHARLFLRRRRNAEEVRRVRPARHFPERLLGTSGVQAAAGSESDGGGALSGSPQVAEGNRQDPHRFRRQESASALPGGWNRRPRSI